MHGISLMDNRVSNQEHFDLEAKTLPQGKRGPNKISASDRMIANLTFDVTEDHSVWEYIHKENSKLEKIAILEYDLVPHRATTSYSDVYKTISTSGHWEFLLSSG
ncbi:hypothetical protein AVEN_108262-1 [Araneus ventricosus]|uniref:Uncharacterized protein n=1 Tax=Araneus ventricosus TaxID=182803 RepID=A0A4Y2DWT7_ARAVE|nr:hypothetical protein AVEN_108262-1 [Araneus ventricosus]